MLGAYGSSVCLVYDVHTQQPNCALRSRAGQRVWSGSREVDVVFGPLAPDSWRHAADKETAADSLQTLTVCSPSVDTRVVLPFELGTIQFLTSLFSSSYAKSAAEGRSEIFVSPGGLVFSGFAVSCFVVTLLRFTFGHRRR
jgi:hypothetical protein